MRRRLAAVLVSGFLAVGAPAAQAGEVVFPQGAVIGLAPPAGMVPSATFSGFEDRARNASILIVDMPPDAFPQLEAGFSPEALAGKGITVETREPFAVDGARALLVTGTQSAGPLKVKKWILLAGNDSLTALVTMQVAESEAAQFPDADVRASLASLAFRSPQDQLAALPFSLSDLGGFRVVRTFGGAAVMLTDGPKNTIEGIEQPYVMVSVAGGAPRDDERRQFAIRALSTLTGIRDLRLDRAEPLRIHQQTGYEVMATGVDAQSGTPVKVVQWLRFGQAGHMRMVGITRLDDFPELYPRLRAIRDGFAGR